MGAAFSGPLRLRIESQFDATGIESHSDWTDLAAESGIVPALAGDFETFTRYQRFVAENHLHLQDSLIDVPEAALVKSPLSELQQLETVHVESLTSEATEKEIPEEELSSRGIGRMEDEDLIDESPLSLTLHSLASRTASGLFQEISANDPTGRVLPRALSQARSFYSPFRSGYANKVLGPQSSLSKLSFPDGVGDERQLSQPLDQFIPNLGSPLASPSTSARDISQYFNHTGASNTYQKPPLEEGHSPLRLPTLAPSFSRLSTEQSSSGLRVALLKEESSLSKMNRRSSLSGGLAVNFARSSVDSSQFLHLPEPGDRRSDRQVLPPIQTGAVKERQDTRGGKKSRERTSSSSFVDTILSPVRDEARRQSSSGIPSAFGRTQTLKKSKSQMARLSEGGGKRPASDITVGSESLIALMPVQEKDQVNAISQHGQMNEPLKPKVTRPQFNVASMTMQRIVDRANSQATESVLQQTDNQFMAWSLPQSVVKSLRLSRFSQDLELHSYRELAEAMLTSGKVALQLIASNDYALVPFPYPSCGPNKFVDLWSLDPHNLIDPSKSIKQGQEVQIKAGLGVRFLAASAAEASRSVPGSNAHLKLVIHCTETQRDRVVHDLTSRSFCGFNPSNILLVVQEPNHAGFLFNEHEGRFEKQPCTQDTAPASRGDGYSMLLISAADCCWTIARDGVLSPANLSAQDMLLQWGVEWLITSSLRDLNVPNISIASLASLAYARVRGKAGVVAEVVLESSMVLARSHEGLFFSKKDGDSELICNLLPRDFATGTAAHKAVSGCINSQGAPITIPCSNGRYYWHLPSLCQALASNKIFIPRLTLSSQLPTLVSAVLDIGDLLPYMPNPQLHESNGRNLVLGKNGASPGLLQTSRSQDSQLQNALMERNLIVHSPRRIFLLLMERNQATHVAISLAMMLAKPDCDEIRLVSVRASESDQSIGDKDPLNLAGQQVRFSVPTPVKEVVLGLSPGEHLLDIVDDYAAQCSSSVRDPELEGSVVLILGSSSVTTKESSSTALSLLRRLVNRLPVIVVTSNNESSIGHYSPLAVSPTPTSIKVALLAFDLPTSKGNVELLISSGGLLVGERGDELTLFTPPGAGKQSMVDHISKVSASHGVSFQHPFVLDLPQGSLSSPLGITGIEDTINSGLEETKVGLLAISLQQNKLPPSILALLASSHAALLFTNPCS